MIGVLNCRRVPALLLLAATLLTGCSSRPKDITATPSVAVSQRKTTGLGGFFAEEVARHPGQSGFLLLEGAGDAFVSRLGLADVAERTLDLQYYVWDGDTTGRLLLKKIFRAADRGVRVRLLLDDHAAGGRDHAMAAVDAHPQIEVRMYNPYNSRTSTRWVRTLAFLRRFRRLNHRMHNKLFVADNQAAIVGGRNIGDEYFGVNDTFNYFDLDLLAVGPVVDDVSGSFDLYWNSEWSVTLDTLHKREATPEEIATSRERLRELLEDPHAVPYSLDFTADDVYAALEGDRDNLVWAESAMVYDQPRKDLSGEGEELEHSIVRELRGVAESAHDEVLGAFAYFMPTKEILARWSARIDEGMRIAILTNSMGSNDVTVAQYGYRKRRKRALASGVELYELRADAPDRATHVAEPEKASILTLHAKAAVFDRTIVFVGSLNLDPRSLNLNTETGLIVHSPELAQQVAEAIETMMLPRNSYRVVREPGQDAFWHTEEEGVSVELGSEPDFGCRRSFAYGLFWILPVGSQL